MFSKPYLLQCIFESRVFPELTQVWGSPAAFSDLPQSAKEVCHFYSGSRDEAFEQGRLFWHQFQDPTRRVILEDKLKQLEELQRLARLAMEQVLMVLWWEDPITTTYFELSQRLQEGRAWIRRMQKSTCSEGARQAWAAMQVHFPNLDLKPIARVSP